MKQGVDILPIGEDGRGIRVSNNAPWYQKYYKKHGKAPSQAQLRDLAYLLTVSDASAPEVEGWIPTTREAAEAMDGARGELDELNGHIQTLENIKDRMMKVDSFEVKGSAGLSPEAYSVYRQIVEMLENIGVKQKDDKQTKVARMNAMLFAHHAEIFAAAMRTQEGKEKYTALDYFRDRFALRYGGTDMRQNGLYRSAGVSAEERLVRDEAAWNALVDRYDAEDKGKWKNREAGQLFRMMDVPLVMQLLHIPYDSIHVFGSFFAHSVRPKHKGMTLDLLRQLPRQMADPLMITRGNKPDSYVFVVDLKDTNGATIVVPVEIEKDVKSIHATVNIINSAFGKTTGKNSDKPSLKWFEKQFNDNNILYVNKNKSTAWLQPYRNSSPAVATISNALFASIVSSVGQNVKTEVDLDAAREENQSFNQSA